MLAAMTQRVLITGGEGDLARSLTDVFRDAGAEVLCPGRQQLDVTDPESVASYFADLPQLDLLIANAGLCENALLARTDEASWDRQLDVNLHGAYRCARAALRTMLRARHGHLVFLSSYSALHPPAGQAAYAAAKAGLIGMAKSLAREVGPAGIRCNVVLPGFMETRMTRDLSESRRASVRADHALGQLNTPQATASFVLHLHQAMPHTSGQAFQLDSR